MASRIACRPLDCSAKAVDGSGSAEPKHRARTPKPGPHADEVVRRLTRLVDAVTAPVGGGKPATDASSARWTLESARKAADNAGAPGKRYLAALDALLARLPK